MLSYYYYYYYYYNYSLFQFDVATISCYFFSYKCIARCVHISDIGVGYVSTMLALHSLFLRYIRFKTRIHLYRLICPSFRTSNCMYIRQCVCLTFKQQKDHVYNNEVRTED